MFNNFFLNKFNIGRKVIGKKTFIIAEAGSNHNGDIKQAIKLIDIAANSGADVPNAITVRPITKSEIFRE